MACQPFSCRRESLRADRRFWQQGPHLEARYAMACGQRPGHGWDLGSLDRPRHHRWPSVPSPHRRRLSREQRRFPPSSPRPAPVGKGHRCVWIHRGQTRGARQRRKIFRAPPHPGQCPPLAVLPRSFHRRRGLGHDPSSLCGLCATRLRETKSRSLAGLMVGYWTGVSCRPRGLRDRIRSACSVGWLSLLRSSHMSSQGTRANTGFDQAK